MQMRSLLGEARRSRSRQRAVQSAYNPPVPMAQLIGSGARLGPYEIVALIGAGGMGEEGQSSVASHQSPVGLKTDDERLATVDERLTPEALKK